MNQRCIKIGQHSPSKIQVVSNPVKEMSKFLQKNQYTVVDLMGLSWAMFEEDY